MKKSRDQTPLTSMGAQRKEGKETTGLLKFSGKSGWKVNGIRLFGSFYRKISGNNKTSEKVVLFFRTEYSKLRALSI